MQQLSVGHLLQHTSTLKRLSSDCVVLYELHTLISLFLLFYRLHLPTWWRVLPSLRVSSTARVQSLADVVFGRKRHVFYAYLYLFILTSCMWSLCSVMIYDLVVSCLMSFIGCENSCWIYNMPLLVACQFLLWHLMKNSSFLLDIWLSVLPIYTARKEWVSQGFQSCEMSSAWQKQPMHTHIK